MIVPVYQEQDQKQDIGTPTAHVEAEGPGVSAAGIYEAEAGIGQKVEGIGTDVARYLVWEQRNAARADGYQRINGYAINQDSALNGEGGFLTKQRGDAVGIVHGKPLPPGQTGPTDLDPNSYIGQESKWREDALKGLSPGSQEYTEVIRGLDSHRAVGFNAVVKHEATQAKLAQVDTANATVQTAANTFASSPDINSDAGQALLKHAQDARTSVSQMHGESPETTAMRGLAVGDTFAQEMVKRQVENNPDVARDQLEAMHKKGIMSEDAYGALKATVDGKWVAMRQTQVADQVFKDTANSDAGVLNYGRVDEETKHLVSTLPAGQQTQIQDYVHRMAERQNAAFEQTKKTDDAKFGSEISKAFQDKVPPEIAYDKFIKNRSFIDNNDRDEKTKLFQSIYTQAPDAMTKVLQTQTPEQKLAWDWVNSVADSKFKSGASEVLPGDESSGIKTNMRDAFVSEMQRKYMGKSAAEIRAGVIEDSKDIITKPGWMWNTTQPKWEITRDANNRALDERAKLIGVFGEEKVSGAEAVLEKAGQSKDPKNVKAVIDKYNKAHGP